MPPPKLTPPPFVIVAPLIVRLPPGLTKNTRLVLLPEIRRLLAPVEFVIVNVPAVEAELMTNSPLVKVIVQTPPAVQPAVPAGIAKLIVSLAAVKFAEATATRKLSGPLSVVFFTVKVAALADSTAAKQIKNINAVINPDELNDDGNNAQILFIKSDIS